MMKVEDSRIGKCSLCKQIMAEENFESHICNPVIPTPPPHKRMKTIFIIRYLESKDQKGNNAIFADGLDGVIYKLVHSYPTFIPFILSDGSKHPFKPDGEVPVPDSMKPEKAILCLFSEKGLNKPTYP